MRAAGDAPGRLTPDWRASAPCKDEPDAMYPSSHPAEIEYAKAFCRPCPVIDRCRAWALDTRELLGVWGGLDEEERRDIFRSEGRLGDRPAQGARGPKQPLPKSVTDLFERHASPSTAGHMVWTGAKTPIFRGRQLTPNQVAFIAGRGREPKGPVHRTCDVKGCVQPKHLADERDRHRARPKGALEVTR